MRKNIMKVTTLVLLATLTMTFFAGCGTDSSSVADNKKTETEVKSDSANEAENSKDDSKNNAGTSKKEASQEVNPFLGPNGLMFASEDDVVINISGVDVPMTLKRDELIALIEENNWEIKYDTGNKDRINSFITPDGKVYVNCGEELMHIEVLPDQIDFTKVTINGANLEKVEKFKNDSNVVESSESSFKISIADYTTLTANYNNEGEVYIIFITRLPYSLR